MLFCGGQTPASEIDHQPAKIIFQINTGRKGWNFLLALTAIDRRAPTKPCSPSYVASPDRIEPMPRVILIG